MTRRTEQLSSVVHRAVQSVLSEGLSDPRLQCAITITSVKVTQDLQEAILGVSIMPEKFEARAIRGLEDASNHVRREAGERVAMARMPKLVFKLDRSAKRQARVLAALADVARENEQRPPAHEPGAVQSPGLDPGDPDHTNDLHAQAGEEDSQEPVL